MKHDIFLPANILLPQAIDETAFSVVACDQYTSEPDYWNNVTAVVGEKPSALHLIFPEIYLKTADFEETVNQINQTMQKYLSDQLFCENPDALIYVERTLRNGQIRRGLVGKIDLEEYDYTVGSQSPVRATEGTVLDRIPPRVKVREYAPLELPHVMLLIDDLQKKVIEPITKRKAALKQLYSFPLMQNSGSIAGYLLDETEKERVLNEIAALSDMTEFSSRYQLSEKELLLFAVGDGNHSLATARQCYLNLKEKIGADKAMQHPARYALTELVNLHDKSLEFEAIHRVLFQVTPTDVLRSLGNRYALSQTPVADAQRIDVVIGDSVTPYYITNPTLNLPVGSLQVFLDEYIAGNGGEVDYIHGETVVKALCGEKDTIGFILPCMDKNDLFKTVILDGALPRKTFSMGEACDKRFYLEARKITV